MALYLVRCLVHGEQDVTMPMQQAAAGLFCCPECHGPASKVYRIPADHSENSWKAYWSDQLSTGTDPVYVKSRSDYRGLMKQHGLAHHEKGMEKDRARGAQHERDQAARTAFREMMDR